MKQTSVRRERNIATKRDVKLATKAFLAKPTAKSLSAAQSAIDTAVKKNVLNKTTAAHKKSRLAHAAKEAGVKLSAKKATKPSTASTAARKPATKKTTATATKKPATSTAKKPAAKTTSTTTAKKPAATKKPAAKKSIATKPTTKK